MSLGWIGLGGILGLFAAAAIRNLALARATNGTFRGRRWVPFAGAGAPALPAILFELGVGLYFALLVGRHGDDPGRVLTVILFSIPLLVLLLVDAWTRLIHTNLIAGGLGLGLIAAAFAGWPDLGRAVAGGLVGLAIFGLFYLVAEFISRRARVVPFGLGDVYLAAMIGTMVRFDRVFFALFAGILLAALASVVLLFTRRFGARQPLSFGPYLCAGALAALVV